MPGDAHRRLRALVRVFFCLTPDSVRGFAHQEHQGGTIIGTTNRGNPLTVTVTVPGKDRGCGEVDRTDELVRLFRMHDLDALNRPYAAEKGVRVIAVPKTKRPSATTIGNDLDGTVIPFGFYTAVSLAAECLDRLYITVASRGRVIVVEVMGRSVGWIALRPHKAL